MAIVDATEDNQFDNESVGDTMRRRYKGAKKDYTGVSMWRKYESELTKTRTFSKKIQSVGNLAEQPSGSNQLHHMKQPLVHSLWKDRYPVELFCFCCWFCHSLEDYPEHA